MLPGAACELGRGFSGAAGGRSRSLQAQPSLALPEARGHARGAWIPEEGLLSSLLGSICFGKWQIQSIRTNFS